MLEQPKKDCNHWENHTLSKYLIWEKHYEQIYNKLMNNVY